VWRVGQVIDRHPWRVGWNTGVSGVQVLMEMVRAETDYGDVNAFDAFGL
jgi:hypothetical protein